MNSHSSSAKITPASFESEVEKFELAWQAGRPPVLPALDGLSDGTLWQELAIVDMEYRWRQGQHGTRFGDHIGDRPGWRKYYEVHGQIDALPTLSPVVIVEEYRVRQLWGDRPSQSAFAREYPFARFAGVLARVDQEIATDATPKAASLSEHFHSASIDYRDFVIERLIGQGITGKVYRATQTRTGEVVAIKALRKSLQTDPTAIELFASEAMLLESLRHPHILPLKGCGRFPGGGYFLVTTYVNGGDLQTRISESRITTPGLTRIALDVAQALSFAHEHDIVHCDLTPRNILLDNLGRAYVADFGFAHLIGGGRSVPTGGTVGFMAPEVWEPQSASVSHRVDVFGFGAILYASLTGQPPYRGANTIACMETLTAAQEVAQRFPHPFGEIVRQALHADPRERQQSFGQIVALLSV